ncbi:MAG: magnesium transporter [Gemmatimonadota bacterium]|jgi:magnesium transporter
MTHSHRGIEEIKERLAEIRSDGEVEDVREALAELHPSDLADLVEDLDEDSQVLLLSALPAEVASEALAEMEEGEERAELLAALEPARGAELLHELADDDAVDLIGELDPEERRRILSQLPREEAGELSDLLGYGEETAGGLMTTDLVAVQSSLTAQEALEQVRVLGREVEDFYTVFVVDARRRLLGTVGLDALVTAELAEAVERLVEPIVASVLPDVDQEEVGRLIGRYNLASMAVVTSEGELLGRITFDDVIDVIEAEQTEDILLMAGMGGDEEALRYTAWESVRARIPWLVANLATAALASGVVYLFSDTIQAAVILAAVMPIVAGMGGNAGSQAVAVTVRSLALEGHSSPRVALASRVGREVTVGVINGAVLGAVVATLAVMVGGDPRLGLVVLLAMWGNLIVAGFLGSAVPTVMDRLGVDPAVSSSMFVTPFTDLCGFLLLLGLATRLLL